MEKFTVNITGDVNIILPHGKIPRRVRLKRDGYAPVSGFQLTPNDEEYDESNVSVLLAVPGQKAKSMCLLNALIETRIPLHACTAGADLRPVHGL